MNYFASTTLEEEVLRRIKGDFRRQFVAEAIEQDGLGSIPEAWKEEEISENLKSTLQSQRPDARGGEDLPSLHENEVEIARLSLTNSVHGEVCSLRACKQSDNNIISYRLVDEYSTEIEIPHSSSTNPLAPEQVIECFRNSEPSQISTTCEFLFQSYFYPQLNDTCHK
jgi:hypothetical protein